MNYASMYLGSWGKRVVPQVQEAAATIFSLRRRHIGLWTLGLKALQDSVRSEIIRQTGVVMTALTSHYQYYIDLEDSGLALLS